MISDRAHLFSEKRRSSRTVAVCVGVAVLFFVLGAWVRTSFAAWKDPTLPPPDGGTAPINVGSTTQSKTGGLNVATTSGGLGVGTSNPPANVKLDVASGGRTIGIRSTGASDLGFETVGSNTGGNFQGLLQGLAASTTGVLRAGDQHTAVYGDAQDSNVSGAQSLGVYGVAGNATVAGATSVGVYGVGGSESFASSNSFAGFFQGFTRVDPDKDGGTTENAFDVYGKVNGARTGSAVYIEQNAGHNYGLWVSGNGGNAAGRFNGKLEAVTAGPTETPAILGDASAGGTDPNNPRYGVQGLGSDVDSGGESSAGVYGRAGGASGGGNSYGVFGEAGESQGGVSYGLYGISTGKGVGVYGSNDDAASGGTAGLFDGTLRVTRDGFFADTTAFVRDYLFAATSPGTAVVIGSDPNIDSKLVVEGRGRFTDEVQTTQLKLKNQWYDDGVGETHRVYLQVNDANATQLCVDVGTLSCTESAPTNCPASGTVLKYLGVNKPDGPAACTNYCRVIDEKDVACSWSCDGSNPDPLCNEKGSSTSGSIPCDEGGFGEYNSISGFCTCEFFADFGGQYKKATLVHPSTKCIDLDDTQFAPPQGN